MASKDLEERIKASDERMRAMEESMRTMEERMRAAEERTRAAEERTRAMEQRMGATPSHSWSRLPVATFAAWLEYKEVVDSIAEADAARLSGSLYREYSPNEIAQVEQAYTIWKEIATLFLLRYAYNEYGLRCEPRVAWPSSSVFGNVDADVPDADKYKAPVEQSSTSSEAGGVPDRSILSVPGTMGDVVASGDAATRLAQSFATGEIRRGNRGRRSRGGMGGSLTRTVNLTQGSEAQTRTGDKRKAEEEADHVAEHGEHTLRVSEAHMEKRRRAEKSADTMHGMVKQEEKEQDDEKGVVKNEDMEN